MSIETVPSLLLVQCDGFIEN